MGDALARLRDDLVVSRQESPEGVYHVLKDPLRGTYFRLQEFEYAIASALDGVRTAEEIQAYLKQEFDAEVETEELAAFINSLGKRGLLVGSALPPEEAGIAARWRENPLYFRLKAFDPDRLFDLIHPWIRWCFTPGFVIGSALLMGWALLTVIGNGPEIGQDLRRLWNFQSLALAWVVMLSVTTLHEFGHGLTCKHFGGQVKEIGFLLIYFQPAFFCNISDAWLFPRKSHRLWVTAAGAWIETTIWGLAALVWRVTERETWLSGLALIVVATSGIKIFFNVNPLIKLDGYYFLVDLLGIPNLRQRAMTYIGDLWRRATGATAVLTGVSPRERRIFVAYGLLAFLFSYWLLTSILLRFGAHLTAQYQGTGAILFAGLVGLTFATPLRNLARAAPKSLTDGLAALRRHRRGLVAAVVVLLVLWLVHLPLGVAGPVELLPAQNADVRSEIEGIVAEVYVDEGTPVAAGTPLARLEDRDYRARLQVLDATIAAAEARLGLLRAGARRESVTVAELALGKTEERLRFAGTDLERVRQLASREAASREELRQAEQAVTLRQRERDEAEATLALTRAGARPQELVAAREAIAEAAAERQRVAEQLAHALIVAPHAGVVTTPKPRQKVGARMLPGDLVVEVYETSTVTAELAVSERDIGDVVVGQPATVRLRSYPARTFTGTVTAVAPAATDDGGHGDRTVQVAIVLDNRDGAMKPRMTGYGRVSVGAIPAIDLLTRRVRRFIRVEFWSWW